MAAAFSVTQAQLARYAYEELVYTAGPLPSPGLPAGVLPLFTAENWNRSGQPTWQAAIRMLQAQQNPGVTIGWQADQAALLNQSQTGATSALRAGTRQTRTFVPAVAKLALSLTNSSGAAIANWQTNYSIAMRRLTAAEKLLAQTEGLTDPAYQFTAEEKQALLQLDMMNSQGQVTKSGLTQLSELVQKGTLPHSVERLKETIWRDRDTQSSADLWAVAASTGDNPWTTYLAQMDPTNPTKGRFLVLTDVALEGAPGVVLTVDRDGQTGYVQVNGAAYAQSDDEPWHFWVPALDHLAFHLTLAPGAEPTTAYVRLRVLTLEMSDVLAVLFGRVSHPSQLSNPKTYYKTLVGL